MVNWLSFIYALISTNIKHSIRRQLQVQLQSYSAAICRLLKCVDTWRPQVNQLIENKLIIIKIIILMNQ